jgi:hypothetical protein
MEGIMAQFIPATMPLIHTSTGKAIFAQAVQCTTDDTGYFQQDLIKNTEFIAVIDSIGLKANFIVPNESIYDLFELVTMYGTGDATPTDPGSEPDW